MESLIIFLLLLILGFIVGKRNESSHYASIHKRELDKLTIPVVNFDYLPEDRPVKEFQLATGSVVVSVDYYKRFLAGLRHFFGGEIASYVSLIDRARREAVLRMKESCPQADIFLNLRVETSGISRGKKKSVGCVEALAYATAVVYADEIRP